MKYKQSTIFIIAMIFFIIVSGCAGVQVVSPTPIPNPTPVPTTNPTITTTPTSLPFMLPISTPMPTSTASPTPTPNVLGVGNWTFNNLQWSTQATSTEPDIIIGNWTLNAFDNTPTFTFQFLPDNTMAFYQNGVYLGTPGIRWKKLDNLHYNMYNPNNVTETIVLTLNAEKTMFSYEGLPPGHYYVKN